MRFNRRNLLQAVMMSGAALAQPSWAFTPMAAQAKPLRSGFQPCRFGQIHYRYSQPELKQTALPLLCLHASPGSSLYDGDFHQLMGLDRMVLAPDTPGYGLSDRPQTPATIADYAGAMIDLVDALGIKQIDLLGNHTGAAIALEVAALRPRLVRQIVLNSALMYRPEDLPERRASIAHIAAADLEAAADHMPALWREYRNLRADISEERAWQMFWDMNRDPTHRHWGYLATFDYDFPAALAQTPHPMMILNPQDMLHEITARARGQFNGELIDLPWASGTFGIHAPKVAHLVRDFLDGSPS